LDVTEKNDVRELMEPEHSQEKTFEGILFTELGERLSTARIKPQRLQLLLVNHKKTHSRV
jgi:hypothetical protein